MADGTYKKIRDIVPGDWVLSYNEVAKDFRPSVVTKVNENMPKPMVRVTFEDGTSVLCTEDHQFMTDGGWVKAKELQDKDVVSYGEGRSGQTKDGGA
jgi:intein/homing endonuclease